MRLATRIGLVVGFIALASLGAAFGAMVLASALHLNGATTYAIAALAVTPLVLWAIHDLVSRITELHAVLGNALNAFRDGDFGLRLAVRGDQELAELKAMYNALADTVRDNRQALHQKEVLLDTILQRTPVAVVLLNAADRVIYSNAAARELIAPDSRLNGRLLSEVDLVPALRDALLSPQDAIFGSGDEVFHIGQRVFHLNTQRHRLILLERLTPQLRRQEIAVWKKAIRIMNHEINNTVAPISSLFHSARRAQEQPEHRHRLDEIYGLIEERLAFLRTFLGAYAEFARLPEPRKQKTSWSDVIQGAQLLYPFRVEGTPAIECEIDPAQMQQVLINLIKNAHESGGAADEIVVVVERAGTDSVLRVLDRGRGMTEDVMRQALVPFYSTKPDGSGVGLALSNEIVEAHGGQMHLEGREGGGTAVTFWIPLNPAG
ncbi:MAG TPA: ATP-binding protein [Thermoanaerobaculia bacterium]|jgi:nitrogen fixation/metabolism regulation signal transduction histidine kinase|nr:ATP-binding protein [Thermoanaerobaculia bacterium]